MMRVYLALDSHDSLRSATCKRLKRKKLAKHLKVVKKLKSAQVVVTSTEDIESLPRELPPSVGLVQLTDCGGGQRYQNARNVVISNASPVYGSYVGMATVIAVVDAGLDLRGSTDQPFLQLGIVGLGNIGGELLRSLGKMLAINSVIEMGFPIESIAVNDHAATSEHLRVAQKVFGEIDVSLRGESLDELLVSSDIVIVAVHRGPTANPLLGAREVGLMKSHSWVIDVSEEGVVDRSAFDAEDERLPNYIRVDEIPEDHELKATILSEFTVTRKEVAKFVGWVLGRSARNRPIRAVEIAET